MSEQNGRESITAGEAEKAGKIFKLRRLRRQRMGLLIRAHLQAVLDDAQEIVSRRQFVACRAIYPPASRERRKRRDRAAVAQYIVAPAGNELLGLHEELDLANTAAADLDVMPLDCDFAVAAVDVNLLLHRMHVGDRREIQIFAPDEGGKLADEFGAGVKVAGAGARLDQRCAFPSLAPAFVIVERRVRRYRNLGRRWIRSQP